MFANEAWKKITPPLQGLPKKFNLPPWSKIIHPPNFSQPQLVLNGSSPMTIGTLTQIAI